MAYLIEHWLSVRLSAAEEAAEQEVFLEASENSDPYW